MTKRLPPWLKVRLPRAQGKVKQVAGLLRDSGLATVCTEAKCPNRADCWSCGTATFIILGRECTRNCRFCAVETASCPAPPDPAEPVRVAEVVRELELNYAVVTSVTRDDLDDHGANHFAATVRAIKAATPSTKVELLIPDFQAVPQSLDTVVGSAPNIVGHNLETVRRLTPLVRDRLACYGRSLEVLAYLAAAGATVKTALLLGLGESREEVVESIQEAFRAGTRHLALGQYLAPSAQHEPVARYWTPEEFDELGDLARNMGYVSVASGPLVRSSYKAEEYAGRSLTATDR